MIWQGTILVEYRGKAVEGGNPRVVAARLLRQLADGRSISDLLEGALDEVAPRDRGLVQEFCFGVARRWGRLEAISRLLVSKPIKPREGEVRALILLGLYQLIYMRIAPHAAVAETVEAARLLNKKWAVGLINAVLRRFQRESESLLSQVDRVDEARYATPAWLLSHLQQAWPEQWRDIVEAANTHPPMSLRVNLSRISREAYLQQLQQVKIEATPIAYTEAGLWLAKPVDVSQLPGFADGLVSVQDGGAQLAAQLLDPQTGERLLDACAAPGGKSCHLLERVAEGIDLTAVDIDQQRLGRIEQNLQRLGLTARVTVGDASAPAGDWAEGIYDRILLDVPCSATGVIRRHPDIKLLRRAGDIATLVATQQRILQAVWPLLRRGGMLLYATCSLLPEENDLQVARFLAEQSDAREQEIKADWGHRRPVGRQTLPGEETMDGFFYACLEKV